VFDITKVSQQIEGFRKIILEFKKVLVDMRGISIVKTRSTDVNRSVRFELC